MTSVQNKKNRFEEIPLVFAAELNASTKDALKLFGISSTAEYGSEVQLQDISFYKKSALIGSYG